MPESFSEFTDYFGSIMNTRLFELNQTPITPASLVMFVVVILLFLVFSRLINKGLLRRILQRFQIEQATQYTLVRVGHYLTMVVGALPATVCASPALVRPVKSSLLSLALPMTGAVWPLERGWVRSWAPNV